MNFFGHLGHPCLFVEGGGDDSKASFVYAGSAMPCRGDSASGCDPIDLINHRGLRFWGSYTGNAGSTYSSSSSGLGTVSLVPLQVCKNGFSLVPLNTPLPTLGPFDRYLNEIITTVVEFPCIANICFGDCCNLLLAHMYA